MLFILNTRIFFLPVVLASMLLFGGCKQKSTKTTGGKNIPKVKRNLRQIKQDGVLKAITIYSSTSYFLYRGRPMGYEYELLEILANRMGLELEIVVTENLDTEIAMLNKGEGDIVAHGLTVTSKRKKNIAFTEHHTTTHQALIQRKPKNWRNMKIHEINQQIIRDPIELIGKKVHVRRNSSYYQRLVNLSDEIGGKIDVVTVPGILTTEELIKKVADGEIDYTVADYNIASINKTYYPVLDISVPISFSQRIAWAVRNNSPELLEEINKWIRVMRQETDYYVIYNKYFKNSKSYKRRIRSEFFSPETGKLSPYDDLVKKHAKTIGWDWRLLTSLMYQESRFRPLAKSWAGALGLMQVMPATAGDFGIYDLLTPENNIVAGVSFLEYLQDTWVTIPDSAEKVKFILASYNVGQGHVKDARRLAEKFGKDPDLWDDNTAYYILQKSKPKFYNDPVVKNGYCRGEEPYNYVREILQRYEHYKQFVPR